MNHYQRLVLFTSLLMLIVTGCRQQAQTPTETDLQIELEAETTAVGETVLLITVRDSAGNPVNDASVSARGDMNHAGMVPVIEAVEGGTEGVYTIPFEWTMGGDWFVEVTVTLADATVVTETFDFTISAEMPTPTPDEG